jgi:rhodanese-related sulfurtransferase
MKELENTRGLLIAFFAFLLILGGGLIFRNRIDLQYAISPDEALALLNDPDVWVTPQQALAWQQDPSAGLVFVDVRSLSAFEEGHAKDAVHIPAKVLLSPPSLIRFEEMESAGQIPVLYGETLQEAAGPWLLLRQIGFEQVKLFSGAYVQLSEPALADSLPAFSETPQIDTSALRLIRAEAATNQQQPPVNKAEIPVQRRQEAGGEEGC